MFQTNFMKPYVWSCKTSSITISNKMNVDDIAVLNCLLKPLKRHHSSCGFSICFKTIKIVDVPLKSIKSHHLNKLQIPVIPLIDSWMKHQYLGF